METSTDVGTSSVPLSIVVVVGTSTPPTQIVAVVAPTQSDEEDEANNLISSWKEEINQVTWEDLDHSLWQDRKK